MVLTGPFLIRDWLICVNVGGLHIVVLYWKACSLVCDWVVCVWRAGPDSEEDCMQPGAVGALHHLPEPPWPPRSPQRHVCPLTGTLAEGRRLPLCQCGLLQALPFGECGWSANKLRCYFTKEGSHCICNWPGYPCDRGNRLWKNPVAERYLQAWP